jgi:hypothetical protein
METDADVDMDTDTGMDLDTDIVLLMINHRVIMYFIEAKATSRLP